MRSTRQPGRAPVKPPSKRVVYGLVAFFMLAGLGLIAGGAVTWQDEHSGIAGTAHIYKCYYHSAHVTSATDCYARWTYEGRPATGYIENGRRNQLGKDVSVRIHGTGHVTEQTYWVPIGLWVFGLFVLGVFGMVLVQYRRRQAQSTTG